MTIFEVCLLVSALLAAMATFGVAGRFNPGWAALCLYFAALLFLGAPVR